MSHVSTTDLQSKCQKTLECPICLPFLQQGAVHDWSLHPSRLQRSRLVGDLWSKYPIVFLKTRAIPTRKALALPKTNFVMTKYIPLFLKKYPIDPRTLLDHWLFGPLPLHIRSEDRILELGGGWIIWFHEILNRMKLTSKSVPLARPPPLMRGTKYLGCASRQCTHPTSGEIRDVHVCNYETTTVSGVAWTGHSWSFSRVFGDLLP